MTVTDAERQQVIADYQREEAEKLRKRLSKAGKRDTPKKRKATLRNIKKAHAALQRKLKDPEWRKKRWPKKNNSDETKA